MKAKLFNLTILFFLGTTMLFSQAKTESVKVDGNCGVCKKRIEKAAKSVDGVSMAIWSKETKIMEVTFDSTKTTFVAVQMAVAKSGHNNGKFKVDEKVYDSLPECCRYHRAKPVSSSGK